MVIKRQCGFCAGEIEPGTGLMYVKRDGTVFHFCSGSCRKQQMGLGRVGHRVRWTRAHALKRELATAQTPAASAAAAKKEPKAAATKEAKPAERAPSKPAKAAAETEKPAAKPAAKPAEATKEPAAPKAKPSKSKDAAPPASKSE